jgi:hypothetical protein
VFVLESKVGATLEREQLLRYRSRRENGTTNHLIAITKHRPDVSPQVLARHEIHSLRWQDIHRALADERAGSAVDRFITRAFNEFLEEADMAYPQQLTLSDLRRASDAVRSMRHGKSRERLAVRQAFHALHGCTGLLRELGDDLRENVAALTTFHRSGPSLVNEKWHGNEWNWIVIDYHRGLGAKRRSFGWGIGFHTAKPRIQWNVWRFQGHSPDESRYPIAKFVSRGRLDPQKLLENLREHAQKWNLR